VCLAFRTCGGAKPRQRVVFVALWCVGRKKMKEREKLRE
jgi:hypothetical protein